MAQIQIQFRSIATVQEFTKTSELVIGTTPYDQTRQEVFSSHQDWMKSTSQPKTPRDKPKWVTISRNLRKSEIREFDQICNSKAREKFQPPNNTRHQRIQRLRPDWVATFAYRADSELLPFRKKFTTQKTVKKVNGQKRTQTAKNNFPVSLQQPFSESIFSRPILFLQALLPEEKATTPTKTLKPKRDLKSFNYSVSETSDIWNKKHQRQSDGLLQLQWLNLLFLYIPIMTVIFLINGYPELFVLSQLRFLLFIHKPHHRKRLKTQTPPETTKHQKQRIWKPTHPPRGPAISGPPLYPVQFSISATVMQREDHRTAKLKLVD
jgi:hypothetical protein